MNGDRDQAPALTVVVAAMADAAVLETTLLHLRAQTIRAQLEIIVATPSVSDLGSLPINPVGFYDCRVLEVPAATTGAELNAAGTHAARATVVAFAEDHAFADRSWGEALLQRHQEEWAAVAGSMTNANPGTLTSWADFITSYGAWLDPVAGGLRPFLPGHNCSYKRAALLSLGDELAELLESETVLHYRLVAEGHHLYMEPRARIAHTNFSRLSSSLRSQFHSGRVYAGTLRSGWSRPRKVSYALASPLIPFVRFSRCFRQMRQPGRREVVPLSVLPVLALTLLTDGVGQITAHVAGSGDSDAQLSALEFRRIDHLTSSDRRSLEALAASRQAVR